MADTTWQIIKQFYLNLFFFIFQFEKDYRCTKVYKKAYFVLHAQSLVEEEARFKLFQSPHSRVGVVDENAARSSGVCRLL